MKASDGAGAVSLADMSEHGSRGNASKQQEQHLAKGKPATFHSQTSHQGVPAPAPNGVGDGKGEYTNKDRPVDEMRAN